MSASLEDRLFAAVLILVSALWCWAVLQTIPATDDGSGLGARGFPLGLGIGLGALGAIVLLRSFAVRRASLAAKPAGDPATRRRRFGNEVWAVAITVALLIGYALLLARLGFLIATAITVVVALGPALGIWRPRLLIGMSLGIPIGIYLIFGKLLGVYLPHGTWLNLAF